MSGLLHWESSDGCLRLSGELNRETLLPLWQQRQCVRQRISRIDVAGLSHVDTVGLALLVHLCTLAAQDQVVVRFTGIPGKLYSLIRLYNLQQLIVSAD